MYIHDGICHNRLQLHHSEALGYTQLESIIIWGALKAQAGRAGSMQS